MTRILRALFLFAICWLPLSSVLAQDTPVIVKTDKIEEYNGTQYYIHIVEEGHTLYSVSRVYQTPIADLIKVNPGLNSDLKPGQIIKIPVIPGEAPELKVVPVAEYDTSEFLKHKVLKGETLYRLSKMYDVTVAEIQQANDGLPGGLKAGASILIPRMQNTQAEETTEVMPGVKVVKKEDDGERPVVIAPDEQVDKPQEKLQDTTYISHEVKWRETLYSISRRYKVPMDQIIKANPELKERKLNWRDVLRIPQIESVVKAESEEEAPVKRFVEHEVEKGETLWSVSREYGVTVEDILAANPDAQKGIKRNKILRIPVLPEETTPEVESVENDTVDEVEAGNTVVKITDAPQMCAEGDHNKEFMVALMLPLYLNEEVPENYQDTRSLRFLDFYKGTRMAMDSLAGMGMKVNLKVYDVDDSYGKISDALNDPELEQADLIVGPLFRNSFLQVAEFASKHEIPIVNPLTKSDNVIRSNENVFKVQVPEEIHLKLIAHSIRKHYPDANIVLVRHNPYQDKERADAIREALNGKLKDRVLLPNSYLYNLLVEKSYNDTSMHDGELFDTIYIENTMFKEDFLNQEIMSYTTFPNKIHDLIYTNDTIYGFTKYASLARKNIFVSLTDDKVFTMEVLSRLNSLKDTFDLTVYTLPGVFEYELETDFLASMDMHVSASGYLDFGTPDFEAFEDAYFDRWGHYPENHIYACLAYDIGMYFGSALYRFGSEFGRCLPNHPYESLYMNFFFVGKEGQGYENGFASIYRIKDFHFVPEEELLYSGE